MKKMQWLPEPALIDYKVFILVFKAVHIGSLHLASLLKNKLFTRSSKTQGVRYRGKAFDIMGLKL